MEIIEKYKHDEYKMQIQNFNQKIIDENVEINIVDFVKLLNHEIYHIDITFIDDLLLLIDNTDQFCIPHELLYKYGVLSGYNTNDVKTLLCQHGFLENESYKVNYGTVRSGKEYLLYHSRYIQILVDMIKKYK